MPSTFRTYFAVWGDWPDAAPLTQIIGREPTAFHAKGSSMTESSIIRKRSIWQIDSRQPETESIETQIESLLDLLELHASGVRQAVRENDGGIQCAAYWRTSQPGFHLSSSLVERVAALGLSLDFDMYALGGEDSAEGG